MKKWLKVAGATVAAGLLVLGTTSASASQSQGAFSAAAKAASAVAVPPPASRQSSSEAKYIPLSPCRIVDTRTGTGANGTPFGSTVTRSFYVGGTTGFAPQGGRSGGCGIPVGAVAVAAVVTAVNPSNAGYVRAWPFGQTEPTATILNYGESSSGTGVTLSISTAAGKALYVRNYSGPTDIVIDVLGYYAKPLHGMISDAGAPYAGSSRILAATQASTGVYNVQFDVNIHYCSAIATVWDASYYASTDTYLGGAYDTVQVRVYNNAGTPVNRYFYIEVVC